MVIESRQNFQLSSSTSPTSKRPRRTAAFILLRSCMQLQNHIEWMNAHLEKGEAARSELHQTPTIWSSHLMSSGRECSLPRLRRMARAEARYDIEHRSFFQLAFPQMFNDVHRRTYKLRITAGPSWLLRDTRDSLSCLSCDFSRQPCNRPARRWILSCNPRSSRSFSGDWLHKGV